MQVFNDKNIIFGERGIDTIRQIAHYNTFKNIIVKNGFEVQTDIKNLPINPYIAQIYQSLKNDPKNRYKKEAFKPVIEYAKISQGNGLSNYIIIVKNIPLLFEYALAHKKAKDTFCLLIYTGLHQPTKQINNEAIKFISKLLRRKTFILLNCDVASDFKDNRDIDYRRKEEFKSSLEGVNNDSYIVKHNSLYCNKTTLSNIDKILLYDKYKKQTIHQKQSLNHSLTAWKRLEITIKPKGRTDFISFIKNELPQSIETADKIAHRLHARSVNDDYLIYQIKAFTDGRTLNRKGLQDRFNSKQALDNFINTSRKKRTQKTDKF